MAGRPIADGRGLDHGRCYAMTSTLVHTLAVTLVLWCGAAGVMPAGSMAIAADGDDIHKVEHAGESHETVHEEGGSLLSIQKSAYFWQILLFLILFAVLAKFVWPPILRGLRDRENKIRDDLQRAEDAANQAVATLEKYKQQIADAHKQAQQLIDQSRSEAEKVAMRLRADAEAEIQRLRDRTSSEIAAAKEQALSELYAQTAVLATEVAGQILRREINPGDQQDLVQKSLNQLSGSSHN